MSLEGGPSYTYLFDTDSSPRNGVSLQVCKEMFSALMAAKLADKKVLIRFNDYDNCAAIPAWQNAGTLGWTQLFLE